MSLSPSDFQHMIHDLKPYIGQTIVLDTRSSWMYIGTLENVSESTICLTHVDVQDNSDSNTSKDRYLFESRETGIKMNRDRVYVNMDYLVSFSLLDDVKQF